MAAISPQLADILLHREVFSAVISTMQGVVIWDFIINIGPELRYIFGPKLVALLRHGRIPSLSAWILFVSRLMVIPHLATTRILMTGRTDHCMQNYRFNLVLYALITAAGSAVFVVRTIAIRSSRRPLAALLWTLWLTQLIVWLYWSTLPIMEQFPRENHFTIACRSIKEVPSWTWVLYLCFGLFDFFMLMLTLESQREHLKSKSFSLFFGTKHEDGTLKQFFQDTWSYFALSAIVSVIEVAWVFQFRNNAVYLGLIAPFHTWLCMVIAPRAIRTLLLKAAKKWRLERLQNAQKGITTGGVLCFSTTTTSTMERKREHDHIAFDTSILSRISPADHYFPPAHTDSLLKATSNTIKFPPPSVTVQQQQQIDSQATVSEKDSLA